MRPLAQITDGFRGHASIAKFNRDLPAAMCQALNVEEFYTGGAQPWERGEPIPLGAERGVR